MDHLAPISLHIVNATEQELALKVRISNDEVTLYEIDVRAPELHEETREAVARAQVGRLLHVHVEAGGSPGADMKLASEHRPCVHTTCLWITVSVCLHTWLRLTPVVSISCTWGPDC